MICKNPCHCVNKHQFCRSCVTVWSGSGNSENHNKCPVCRVSGYYLPSGAIADNLNSRQVRCLLRSCIWVGQLKNIHNHRHVLNKKLHHEDNYNKTSKSCHNNNNDSNNNDLNIRDRCSEITERVLPKEPSSAASILQRIRNERKEALSSNSLFTEATATTTTTTQLSPSLTTPGTGLSSRNVLSSSISTPVTNTSTPNNNNMNDNNSSSSINLQHQHSTLGENNHVNERAGESIENVLRSFIPATTTSTTNTSHLSVSRLNNNINNSFSRNDALQVTTPPQPSAPLVTEPDNVSTNPNSNFNRVGPIHHRSVNRRTGPKEYERLRARMRETRLRLEQMETTRRELASFQERQRLQHLVEVRELGRQLNEVTFQIRRLLNQMSANEDHPSTQLVN